MVNSNKEFEINECRDIFLIIYSIWIYSYNNNFSAKKSYLDNQFMLNYGISIQDYLIENPILEKEIKNELETKDLINSIYSLMNIQNSLDKKMLNHLMQNYNLEKTSSSIDKLSQYINSKLDKIVIKTRLSSKDKNKFSSINTCDSLLNIAWINLSEIIATSKLVKICQYIKCHMIFVSNRKSSAYCNSKCQTRAKSHRAYYGASKKYDEGKLEIGSNKAIKNNDINRLPPEEYKIPDEYEPDFGFFDGEDDKLKIMGS
tara:strand:+ start:3161 stop:3937 length:777 start_codon:yes stop_codon:yes gene_type:complete